MRELTLQAPAKVNLYLSVLDKRPDGYHNIETVFEKIDLCDTVTLKRTERGIKLYCRHKDLSPSEKNLGEAAAEALKERTGFTAGVRIKIAKKIPVAAGLAGGSSDAAAVLSGLNKLLSLGLNFRQLAKIAEGLGADVPFFLTKGQRAIGRGKGEVLTPLVINRSNWYVLVLPYGLKVSTRQMYQHPRITLTKRPYGAKIILRALEKGDLSSLDKYSYNSFEPILTKKYKQIETIKKALKAAGAGATLVSGSGPCVFGICATRKEAVAVRRKLRAKKRNWRVILAATYSNA